MITQFCLKKAEKDVMGNLHALFYSFEVFVLSVGGDGVTIGGLGGGFPSKF